jgi:hypothetical protein
MRQRSTGPHGGCNERRLRQFLFGYSVRPGMPRVHVTAISALGGERDADCYQFPVFARDSAVLALRGAIER